MKHLQHTSETLETDACNIRFQANISLLLGRIETHRHVEFTGGAEIVAPVEKATACPMEKAAARLHTA
jgi:hypothetical protein